MSSRGLQQSLTRVLSNVQDLRPDDVLSDVSMLSAFDSWKPSGINHLAPRFVATDTYMNALCLFTFDFRTRRKRCHYKFFFAIRVLSYCGIIYCHDFLSGFD